ncbi:MAG: OmpA family protein [Candidatus Kapabacteria bacterium]|nr:OmpA family protein [Candidatus Kapabacteria bacterium]MDW8012485.1 OmpA family protein [Bacteroidota bacterium]
MRKPVLIVSVGAAITVAAAQQPALRQWTSLGLWGAVGANFHAPDLQVGGGVYNRSATGVGWGIGGSVTFPLSSAVGLGVRVGYEALGAELKSTTDTALGTRIGAVELFPHALIWLGRFYIPAGVELGIGAGASYQRQGQTTWQDIPDQALRFALGAGIGWALPLSRSVTLAPEVGLRVPLTDVSSADAWSPWKVTQLRLTVGLHFGIAPTEPRSPTPEPLAPTVALTSQVRRLTIEEVRLTEYFPLLPYIFFPQGQASLANAGYRLTASKAEFSVAQLPMDALEVNRSILDVLGKRLTEYPTARLTLTGTTDGRQEAWDAELPRNRAEAIRQYLVTTWGIAPDRIAVQGRRYPQKPSATRSTVPEDRRDADAENRRVEVSSNVPEVLAPVALTAENQRYVRPEVVSWDLQLSAATPIASWELVLSQAGQTIDSIRGQGQPSSPLVWHVPAAKLRAGELPLEYVFRVTDARGRTAETVGSIPVDYVSTLRKRAERLPDRTVVRFSLVLFDFDSDALTPENQQVLEQLVLPSIQATSRVRIVGYTDRIGEEQYNQELSLRRAQRVRDFLSARVPGAQYEVAGYGESLLLFDNNDPIGRQLCRTVQITVETPGGTTP